MPSNIPPGGSIPPSVRAGVRLNRPQQQSYTIHKKPTIPKPSKSTLTGLLTWGLDEERKCLELLKVLPPELPEYNELLQRLDKLQKVIAQTKSQIGRKVRRVT